MTREHAERVYFEQVKRAVPIEAVLARYGIELKRSGTSLKGRCPIHNGTNPTQFVVSTGLWHCFGDCGRGGSVIELVAELEKVDARNAALMIARWFAIGSADFRNQHSKQRSRAMAGEKPSHKAFTVTGEGESAFWVRLGSAWPNRDGKGLSVILDGLPVNGRLVLREYTEDDEKEEEQQKSKRKK